MAYIFHDMKIDEKDAVDMAVATCAPEMPQGPRYPYGLCLHLDTDQLEKLGFDIASATVGGMVHLHAIARITCVSSNEREGGEKCNRVELQIEQLCLESEDKENKEADASGPKKKSMQDVYK